MAIYVNRSLNLKKIKVIGFDLDHTLVRYNTKDFEELAHQQTIRVLVEQYGYPNEIQSLVFDHARAIVGLVIDGKNGNLLKLNCFGKVKTAFHGLEEIHYRQVRKFYENVAIDVRDPDYIPLDTNFAISTGVLYSQLIDLYNKGLALPGYADMARNIISALDMAHIDGSIKDRVVDDPERYIIPDPQIPQLLERCIAYGKKLMIITNSDYIYARAILDYAFTPFLGKSRSWMDLFEVVITLADKPGFFQDKYRFLKVDIESGDLQNYNGPINQGVYQGGCFRKLQDDLDLQGDEILYLGDHIYGDIVAIKKLCGWRTGLILDNLEGEIQGIHNVAGIQQQLTDFNSEKLLIEERVNQLYITRREGGSIEQKALNTMLARAEKLNTQISALLTEYRTFFNPYWGELLRAGFEESRYAGQVYSYACVYMTKVADMLSHSPSTYFRPLRRLLPHEVV